MANPLIIVSHPLKEDRSKRGIFLGGDPNEHLFSTCTAKENIVKPCTLENLFVEIDAWRGMGLKEDPDIYTALKNSGNSAYICFFDYSTEDDLFLVGIASMTLASDPASGLAFLGAFLVHPRCRENKYGTRCFSVIKKFLTAPDIKGVFGYAPKYILIMSSAANAGFWEKQGFVNFQMMPMPKTEEAFIVKIKLLCATSNIRMMMYALV